MANIEVNGQSIEIDDAFLSMSPEQQAAEVDAIASTLNGGEAVTPVSTPQPDTTLAEKMADVQPMSDDERTADEARIREEHAARPQTDSLVGTVVDLIDPNTDAAVTQGASVMDTTIDVLGTVTDPLNDAMDWAAEQMGFEPSGRMTDTLKEAMREEEAGFQIDQGVRRIGHNAAMIPAFASGIYGLGGAAIEAAAEDVTFREAMIRPEKRELFNDFLEASPEAIREVMADPYSVLHDDYKTFIQEGAPLRNGLQFAADQDKWAYETTGAAQRADGRVPLHEEITGILGTAFIGLPASTVRSMSYGIANKFGAKGIEVANRMAQSKMVKLAEYGSPITFPLTAKNIRNNMIGGVVVNDVARVAMGEDSTAVGSIMRAAKEVDKEKVAMVGAAGGIGLAAMMLRRPQTARNIITGSEPTIPESGIIPRTRAEMAETELSDADAPIVQLAEKLHGRGSPKAEAEIDSTRMNTRQAGDTRIDSIWREGTAPGRPGEKYTNAGAEIVDTANRTLSKQQRTTLVEGMIAEDVQWSIKNGRGNPTHWTPAQLKQKKQLLDKNPQLHGQRDSYRVHMQEILEQAYKAGLFTKDEFAEMKTRPYVPNIPAKHAQPRATLFDESNRFANQAVSPFVKYRKGDVMDFGDIFDNLGVYEKSMTKQILENRTRTHTLKTYADGIKGMTRAQIKEIFPNGVPIRKAGKGTNAGNTIDVYRNGKKVSYEVGDPLLRNSLKYAPHSVWQTMSDFRRGVTIGTTGEFNLPFAFNAAPMIDGFFSSTMVRRDQVAGFVDMLMHRAGVRQMGEVNVPLLGRMAPADVVSAAARPIDTMTNIGRGAIRGGYEHMIEEMASQLDYRLGKSSLAGILPEPVRKVMSDKMTRAWHKTMTYQMRSAGYAPGRFTEEVGDMSASAFDKAYRALFQKNFVGRQYRAMLNTMKDSYRLSFAVQQRAKYMRQGMDAHNATKRAAREAREVGSDPSRAGQYQDFNKVTSGIPYANIGVQALATAAKATAYDRRGTASLVLMSHAAYGLGATAMLYEMGGAEWWHEQVNDRTRSRGLPLNPKWIAMSAEERESYEFDPGDIMMIDIGPEQAVMRAPIMAAMETLAGKYTNADWAEPRVAMHMREMGEAALALNPLGAPPVANLFASLTMGGPIMESNLLDNRPLFPEAQPGSGLLQDQRETGANAGFMGDTFANVLASVSGIAGRNAADMWEQYEALNDMDPEAGFTDFLDSVWERRLFEFKRNMSPALFNVNRQPDRNTPVVAEAYKIGRAVELISDQVEIDLYGTTGQATDPIDLTKEMMRLAPKIPDANLRVQFMDFAQLWSSDPVINDSFDNMRKLRAEYDLIEPARDVPRQQQAAELDRLTVAIQQEAGSIMDRYERIQNGMAAQHGEGWNVGSMVSEATSMIKRAPRRVPK